MFLFQTYVRHLLRRLNGNVPGHVLLQLLEHPQLRVVLGEPVEHTLSAEGRGPYTFTVTGLPTGLSHATGSVSGWVDPSLRLLNAPPQLRLVHDSFLDAYPLEMSGRGPVTYQLTGTLPPGVQFTQGVLHGLPRLTTT